MLTIDATSKRLNQPRIWSFPSRMKSAGKSLLKSSTLPGYLRQFHEVVPASTHTSAMSGILVFVPPHLHLYWTSSIQGLCRSFGIASLPASFASSATLPMTSMLSHLPHAQIGIGVPQYLCLVMPLSLRLSSHESNCLLPAHSGTQLIFLFSFFICSFRSSTLKNHCFVVLNITGLWQRQQWAYSCCTFVEAIIAPLFSSSSVNFLSSFLQTMPDRLPMPSGYLPYSSTGLYAGMPFLLPISKSSWPQPGAM